MEVEQFERPMMAFPKQLLFQSSLALLPRLPYLFALAGYLEKCSGTCAASFGSLEARAELSMMTSFFFFTRRASWIRLKK